MSAPDGPDRPPEVSPWPFAGMIGMACVFFVFAATPVVLPGVPWWAVVGLLLAWAVAMVLAVQWWTPRPIALAWLPLGLAAAWFVIVLVGARWLGWL